MAIIKAQAVDKIYLTKAEEVTALKEASFEINTGDFIVINGPSGSGKTTLLNLLSGIDQPTRGEIFINGSSVKELSDSYRTSLRRDKIGLIFQSFELIPILNTAENVEYPLLLQKMNRNERRQKVNEVLESVGMLEMAKRFPSQLSGGQKQRVAIARALVTRPQVVLADEPTGNLDSKTGLKIIELMLDLNRKYEVAFIIVTHDVSINQYAKKIYHINDGILTLIEGGLNQ